MKVTVFDPAMCCSTGVCGPSVDPRLARFAADLDWLKASGAIVERFNLSQQPGVFVEHAAVKQALDAKGEGALPVVMFDGEVKSTGVYPSREQLAQWAGVAKPVAAAKLNVLEASAACCEPRGASPADPKKKCC
jgi:hypothetical protein